MVITIKIWVGLKKNQKRLLSARCSNTQKILKIQEGQFQFEMESQTIMERGILPQKNLFEILLYLQ